MGAPVNASNETHARRIVQEGKRAVRTPSAGRTPLVPENILYGPEGEGKIKWLNPGTLIKIR